MLMINEPGNIILLPLVSLALIELIFCRYEPVQVVNCYVFEWETVCSVPSCYRSDSQYLVTISGIILYN